MVAIRNIQGEELDPLMECFNRCLREGTFPGSWKRARLVLIPKERPIDEDNPKARPISLLNEMGKIFESIIVDRMVKWMNGNPWAQLAENQFGFRENRSTNDALGMVHTAILESWNRGEVTIAIGLDIQNAFNSLPWLGDQEGFAKEEFA